jgi:hypothetical protein
MSYLQYFLDERKPLVKRQFVAVEDDWNLIQSVFPEPGFRSYLLGHVVSKIANELRKNGIQTYYDRQERSQFTSIARTLTGIQIGWFTDNRDVGRAAHGTYHQTPCSPREPTNYTGTLVCETESGQEG